MISVHVMSPLSATHSDNKVQNKKHQSQGMWLNGIECARVLPVNASLKTIQPFPFIVAIFQNNANVTSRDSLLLPDGSICLWRQIYPMCLFFLSFNPLHKQKSGHTVLQLSSWLKGYKLVSGLIMFFKW